MRQQRLLYISEHPPSSGGGQPLIARGLLQGYPMEQLHVLCDAKQFHARDPAVRESHLPCRHTIVGNIEAHELRPRRFWGQLADNVNALRIAKIGRAGARIVREHRIEALFTVPWRAEFAIAALQLADEFDLPLSIFEMDDWEAMNPRHFPGLLVRKNHARLLARADPAWLISPHMVRRYRARFGIEGEFLHHFVDVDVYQHASQHIAPTRDDGTIKIVYTGAINAMFLDALTAFCNQLNSPGIAVDGHRVILDIYSGSCPEALLGPGVRYAGFVASKAIPNVLAASELSVVCVSFSEDPAIRALVETSLYTKTIGYLAAGRPVLTIAPAHSAQAQHFADVTRTVETTEPRDIEQALADLLTDGEEAKALRNRGLTFVREFHSLDALDRSFTSRFLTDSET